MHFARRSNVVAELPLEHPHYPASYGAADASITGGNGHDGLPVKRTEPSVVFALPLSALLSEAVVAYAMDYEATSPVALSLSTAVIERLCPLGSPLQEFGDASGISALARHGFVRISGERGNEIVHLTARGSDVRHGYAGRIRAVEKAWRSAFGSMEIDALRAALEDVALSAAPSESRRRGESSRH